MAVDLLSSHDLNIAQNVVVIHKKWLDTLIKLIIFCLNLSQVHISYSTRGWAPKKSFVACGKRHTLMPPMHMKAHTHAHTHAHQGSMARTSTKVIKAIRYCRALASVAVRQSKARPGVRPYAKYTSIASGRHSDTLTHPPHDFKPIKPLTTTTTARTVWVVARTGTGIWVKICVWVNATDGYLSTTSWYLHLYPSSSSSIQHRYPHAPQRQIRNLPPPCHTKPSAWYIYVCVCLYSILVS